jgi:hypothetical protein
MSIIISNGFSITPSSPFVLSGMVFNLQTAPSSGATWIDNSGNGYNATISGSATYVSNNGGGIRLNNTSANGGGNDFISVPYNISSNTVTVEVVASFNPTSYWGTIWGNDSYSASRGYFAYMVSATQVIYGRPQATIGQNVTATNSIQHWTFVINGTSHSLYLNGTQVGPTQTSPTGLFATGNFYFGSRHTNAGTGHADKLNSSITANQPVFYQMRVYNKALSLAELTQNYNAIKSTYGI